jgi:hypothetical protein
LFETLKRAPGTALALPSGRPEHPLGDDDLQLALYCCYELHYRSFADVDERWEWDPGLLAFRLALEAPVEAQLDALVTRQAKVDASDVGQELFSLAASDPAPSLSTYLARTGTLDDFREFVIHRSAYQLKEADPHTFAVPRISGAPKAAMMEIQYDEYGSGRPGRAHSQLFAEAMEALGLDSAYGAYLDRIPGHTLATVNLISMFALHRRLRGALVGHLAMFEITSPVPNRRYATALRRHGLGTKATTFFDEHVEADSVHENVAAFELAQRLAIEVPELGPDILFGARCLLLLEGNWAAELLGRFADDESTLLPAALPVGAAM